MRVINKNNIITVRAYKRHPEMIQLESGRNYMIYKNIYTNNLPFAKWGYWVLKKQKNKYNVLKFYA